MHFSKVLVTLGALGASVVVAAPVSTATERAVSALYSYIAADAELASPEEKKRAVSALYSYIAADAELASPEEKKRAVSALYSYIAADAEIASPEK